jgi:hypothetical protein
MNTVRKRMIALYRKSSSGGSSPITNAACPIPVRRIPYPYEAALAICSDLDETPNWKTYYETARFLNTDRMTPLGPGVNLEVGNTMYFDMPRDQFSYWNTDDAGRSMIHQLVRSGHIDCLHSFGTNAICRSQAEKVINALAQKGCKLEVWIDHSTAPSNFGPDIMRGQGDIPASNVYHADLSIQFGIRFVWIGRVTSVLGQDAMRSVQGIWRNAHPMASGKTVAKELIKGVLARIGNPKYSLHYPNALMRKIRLRDGHEVYEFMRCNPHWKGVSSGDTADGIAEVLTPRFLDLLVKRQATCILYTHLGKFSGRAVPFGPAAIEAFRRLSRYFSGGKILVATTSRLLRYNSALKELSGSCGIENARFTIRIETAYPHDLEGLTLYASEPERTVVMLNAREVRGLRCNPPDRQGCRSVSLPWRRIEFPR